MSVEKPLLSERRLLLLLAAVQFTHIMDFMIMMPLGPQLMPRKLDATSPDSHTRSVRVRSLTVITLIAQICSYNINFGTYDTGYSDEGAKEGTRAAVLP